MSLSRLRWYWATRGIGAVTALYELVLDKHSPDRGTIILAAFGLMGFDWVAKREHQYENQSEHREAEEPEPKPRRR